MEDKQLNIYERLINFRNDIQKSGMKKLGENKFSGYNYFTLDTIVPVVNELSKKHGLASIINFTQNVASLTVYNIDNPSETIIFETPFIIAAMKGQNNIQAVMSAHTYFRRALYLLFADICEPDEIDTRSEEDRQLINPEEDNKKEKLIKVILENKANEQLKAVLKQAIKNEGAKSMNDLSLKSLQEVVAILK